jgi:hypothetical protein
MTDEMKKMEMEAKDNQGGADRRTFIKTAATAAGIVGAIGVGGALAESADGQAAAQAGRGRGGAAGANRTERKPALDMRNPVSFAGVGRACSVMMDHFKALNQRDIKGLSDTFHFPYATFEQTDVVTVASADEFIAKAPASVNMTDNPERFTDHDGYMKPGTYDVFGGMEVFNSDPIQVNISMSYDRYSSSGNRLLRCEGVYCVTNNDGKWAIQTMSTIFTPGEMVGMQFPDSVLAAHRLRETHTLGFQRAWAPGVWANVRQLGPNVGVSAAKDDDYGFAKAPDEKNGVKNRMQITNYTQESLDAIKIDFPGTRNRWKALGMGNWGFDWGGGQPARLIHQAVDKVHYYQGTTRFTAAGEYISNTEEVDVLTLVNGRWGLAGIFGYILNHDRSNDVKNITL